MKVEGECLCDLLEMQTEMMEDWSRCSATEMGMILELDLEDRRVR